MNEAEASRCPACAEPVTPDGPTHRCTTNQPALPADVLFTITATQVLPHGTAFAIQLGQYSLSNKEVGDALIKLAFGLMADEGGDIVLPPTYHPERHD